jgi:hypothetical protein
MLSGQLPSHPSSQSLSQLSHQSLSRNHSHSQLNTLSRNNSSNHLVNLNHNSLLIDAETIRQQELAEKKKRRLERNRASARQCRKRKKEKKMLLRQQLAHLEADNLQLRLKLQIGHDSIGNLEQSSIITSKLNEMITDGASETDIQKKIQELKERFSDYGRDRRSAIDFHINQLRRCLQPTQTTRAILWLMSLAAKFPEITLNGGLNATAGSQSSSSTTVTSTTIPSSSAASDSIATGFGVPLPGYVTDPISSFPVDDNSSTGSGTSGSKEELMALWASLLAEIKPEAVQRQLMISYTTQAASVDEDPFHQIEEATGSCNTTLDRIVSLIGDKNDNLDSEMTNIQNILSPRQIAKFILWIDKNPACMQMLEALWPHLTEFQQLSLKGDNGRSDSFGGDNSSIGRDRTSSHHTLSQSNSYHDNLSQLGDDNNGFDMDEDYSDDDSDNSEA